MDVVFHLHPEPSWHRGISSRSPDYSRRENTGSTPTSFTLMDFPKRSSLPSGCPTSAGRALAGDDAEGTSVALKYWGEATQTSASYKLPDGYTMVWKRPHTLVAKSPYDFTFELLDPNGQPASDMALYMGMPGHAAFVKTDGSVFAHIHPSGSASMAALMIAQSQNDQIQGTPPSQDD